MEAEHPAPAHRQQGAGHRDPAWPWHRVPCTGEQMLSCPSKPSPLAELGSAPDASLHICCVHRTPSLRCDLAGRPSLAPDTSQHKGYYLIKNKSRLALWKKGSERCLDSHLVGNQSLRSSATSESASNRRGCCSGTSTSPRMRMASSSQPISPGARKGKAAAHHPIQHNQQFYSF